MLCRQYDKLLAEFSSPKEGTQALKFDTKHPKPFWVQFQTVFAKYTAAYWRMPEYNGMRLLYAVMMGFVFGAIFWRNGYALIPAIPYWSDACARKKLGGQVCCVARQLGKLC